MTRFHRMLVHILVGASAGGAAALLLCFTPRPTPGGDNPPPPKNPADKIPIAVKATDSVELSARLGALKTQVEKDESLMPPEARKKLAGQLAELCEVANRLKTVETPAGAAATEQLESLIRSLDQKTKQRLDNIDSRLEESSQKLAQMQGLLDQNKREAQSTDVFVLAVHSQHLIVGRFRKPLQQLFGQNYRDVYKNYHLGLVVAIGTQLQQKPFVALKNTLPDLSALDGLGMKPAGVTEQIKELGPKVLHQFDASSSAPKRCIVLTSAGAAAPKASDPGWKDLSVDAILIAEDALDAVRLKAWLDFCSQRHGSMVVVRVPAQDDPKITDLITFHLCRMAHPLTFKK